MFFDHHNQQIVLQKTRNLVGTNQAKFYKILISQAIWLGILCSLVSAILCEANKNNLLREERPIGLQSSAQSKC